MEGQVPADEDSTEERSLSRLIVELREWHVFRFAAGYAVVSWLVVQVVATVGPAFDLASWVLRAVVLGAIVGFLATMAFLLFRRRSVGRGRNPIYLSRRARLIGGLGVLLIAAAAAALSIRSLSASEQVSIAVLPFTDLSPAHDKAYFAEGIAEEILSSLAGEQGIKVLGRTSARQVERNPDPKAIRASLGVTHLLEGSSRTDGNALRVNVRLIDTADGSQVWEEEYDGALSDIFQVQDSIATAVVRRVRGTFLRSAVRAAPSTAIDTYQAYLAARAIMRNRSKPTLRQALGLARQVIVTDPNYSAGHALFAELVWLLSDDPDAYGTIPRATAARISEQHARTAIRLAANQADGYAALGLVADESTAVPALRRAIALDPSRADVRIWLATRFTQALRFDEALPISRDAAAIEPLWPMPIYDLVVRLAVNGQMAEARQVAEQYRSRSGNEAQYLRLLFAIETRGADISSAIALGEKAIKLDPNLSNIRTELLQLYSLLGLSERAPEASASAQLAAPFYLGDVPGLSSKIRSNAGRLWNLPDSGIGFFHLASIHDWRALSRLFDQRPTTPRQLCLRSTQAAQAIVLALRLDARQQDAAEVLGCLRRRLAIETRQKARSWYAYPGDLEYDQAVLAALSGNREPAFSWLNKAVDRGWLGRPYSYKLSDRPQLNGLRSDRRYAAIQRRIDIRIATERAEVLAGPSSFSPAGR